jgi:energy-coupling factor transporter ATP-binding protein EcfA2
MPKERSYSDFNFYQNANEGAEAVKEGFLVRKYEYSVITDDLLRHKGRSVQHYLLLGKRGSGKSTLLRRLQVEIDTNAALQLNYIAINLAEEQANIYRLFDLLEEIVREMEYREIEIEDIMTDSDAHVYSQQLFYLIHRALEKTGKKLVLLLDNIDRIFESLGEDVALLRENLENHGDIKIIGGSTRMTEHFWAYDKPFYEFFRVLELKPLKSDEVKELLLDWGVKLQVTELKDFVENRPGQLEAIRILTDGLPRTLQFFVNILLAHHQETGYDYLRLLMDKITPLYQERLHKLPPSQRKITLQLSFLWEAVGAKEVAQASRMETRVVSAQLSQLIEKGVVEKIGTKTKNHLYRLSERFFNLWLIFTQGGHREKRQVGYLSSFLENFYDRKGLNALEEAEKYYYVHSRDRSKVVLKVESAIAGKQERVLTLMPVIKAWSGDLAGMEADVLRLIREKRAGLDFMLLHLLIHYQINLVQRVFTSPETGRSLIDQFLPLYHATQLLMPEANAYSIRIPPEIREVVNDLLIEVYRKRDFYYNAGEAGIHHEIPDARM